jgi:hypothetical protein
MMSYKYYNAKNPQYIFEVVMLKDIITSSLFGFTIFYCLRVLVKSVHEVSRVNLTCCFPMSWREKPSKTSEAFTLRARTRVFDCHQTNPGSFHASQLFSHCLNFSLTFSLHIFFCQSILIYQYSLLLFGIHLNI